MRRREFITLLGGAAVAWPLAARAQQPAKLPTIGFLGAATSSARANGSPLLCSGLRELGWIEGRTVAIEYRWAEGRDERFAEIAAEFVRLKVDVIVTQEPCRSSRRSRRHRSSRSSSRRRGIRLAPASSRASRDRAATSPACRTSRPILPASGSNSCARLSPVSAGWRSWQCRQSRQRAGDRRGSGSGPRARPRCRDTRNPARRGYRARLRGAQGPRGGPLCRGDPLVFANRIRINTLALGARLPTMYSIGNTSKQEV